VASSKVILGVRTDTAEALVILSSQPEFASEPIAQTLDRINWTAGRQLSATLLTKIDDLLSRNQKTWANLSGIVVYQGPGSFTGLRISLAVANTAAFSLNIPIVGATGVYWLEEGIQKLAGEHFTDIVMPVYGAEPNITQPKK
jgi:tRNA threonylcarbamoyladenosine biosynthesis protein TsaB